MVIIWQMRFEQAASGLGCKLPIYHHTRLGLVNIGVLAAFRKDLSRKNKLNGNVHQGLRRGSLNHRM